MENINKYIKNHFNLIITIFVVSQPIIDVLTSLMVYYGNFLVTIGVISKIILLVFLLYSYFVVFKQRSKKVVLYLFSIFIYLSIFMFINNINDIKELFKILFLPTSFILIYEIFKFNKSNFDYKNIIYMVMIYSLLIIIPYLLNIGFDSYEVAKKGSLGWFNSANEISAIISISLPLIFIYSFNHFKPYKLVIFIPIIASLFIMGTKTPLISLAICLIYYVLKYASYLIKNKKYKAIGALSGIIILSSISLIIIVPKTYIYKNTIIHLNYLKVDEASDLFDYKMMDHFMFGSRLSFAENINEVYIKSPIQNNVFGIGFQKPAKLAEMDFVDIFYRMGIIGLVITLLPIIYLFIKVKDKDKKYYLSIFISILVSIFAGHVLTAPSVSFVLLLIMTNCLLKKSNNISN